MLGRDSLLQNSHLRKCFPGTSFQRHTDAMAGVVEGDSEEMAKSWDGVCLIPQLCSQQEAGPPVKNGPRPLAADSHKSFWSPHRKRNTFSERQLNCHNSLRKSKKIPTLLWIYTEDTVGVLGRMGEAARPGEMETHGQTRSMEAKMEEMRKHREVPHWATFHVAVTKQDRYTS